MRHLNLLYPTLKLFDGAAAGAAAPQGVGEGAQAGTQASSGSGRRSETGGPDPNPAGSGPDAGGQGGKGGNANADGEQKPTLRERKAKFRELMRGEYKDIYEQETQRILNDRFKQTRELQESLNAQRPILDMLAQRYRVESGDTAGLLRAIEADDAYWEKAAEDAGMTKEQYLWNQRLQRENDALRRRQDEYQSQMAVQRQVEKWEAEAEEVTETYPDFKLEEAVEDPEFMRLIQSNVPMKYAYEVLHLDDIKNGVAKSAEKRVADSVRANGTRPVESGISSQSGISAKPDVNNMTAQERARLIERAARGETIVL